MIEIVNVSRYFSDNKAVDSVNIEIHKGEILGLLGHNGAGKTTLMKMLTGFLEPSEGQIHIKGEKIQGDVLKSQPNIGYMPENLPLYPEMTVVDYLDFSANLRGIPESQRMDEIRDAMIKTDLTDKAFARIDTLSRGYRQRVGVAQALLGKPEILILDEPTNGLDPAQTQHMRELILSLKEDATVILSTHIMQEVKAMCDRVVVMRQGSVALDAKLAQLMDNHTLSLRCDAGSERVISLLKGIKCVDTVATTKAADTVYHYQVQIKQMADVDSCTADIVRNLVNDGVRVFGIEPVQFDLERVLQDIGEGEDVEKVLEGYAHAA